MSYISSIFCQVPEHKHQQSDIIDFMQTFYQLDADTLRKTKWVYKKSGINFRYSVLPDFNKDKEQILFKTNSFKEIDIAKRLEIYNSEALILAKKLIANYPISVLEKVTHLITISCTGIAAPGLELALKSLFVPQASQRAINFMGCYAAVHGIKQGFEISNTYKDALVLLVDIELCTLHFQYNTLPDLINSAMIFGDGGASWLIGKNIKSFSSKKIKLKILGNYNQVLHSEQDKMAWYPSNSGFLMQLSSYIPELIGDNVLKLVSDAKAYFNIESTTPIKYCIHPGGLKILDKIAEALNINKEGLKSSYTILENFGNMSSPTVMFVLEDILKNNDLQKGEKLLLMAFGPGLSLETTLLIAE